MHFFGKIGHFHPFFQLETSTSDTFHLRLLILWQIWCQIFFAPPSSCKNLKNTCFQPFLAHFWVVKRPLYDFWPKIQQTRQKLVSYYLNDVNSKIGYLKKAQNMAFSCVFWLIPCLLKRRLDGTLGASGKIIPQLLKLIVDGPLGAFGKIIPKLLRLES